ncbi:MAG: 2-oxoacid:acceptor oxidoreductase family protein [Clostridia bacterium]
MYHEILIAGFGGQGVMLMGRMLAYAGMKRDLHVSWIPSYGPEQRGGTANCGVVLSEDPIASPVVTEPTDCAVMNLPSLTKFEPKVTPGGYLYINTSLCPDEVQRKDIEVIRVPATEEADSMGNTRVANMIMLGAMMGGLEGLPSEVMEEVLPEVLPKRHHQLIPVNLKALSRGREIFEEQS